jgi:hypothetical protein
VSELILENKYMKSFVIVRNRGEQTFARAYSDYIDARVLAANVNETHTVPTGSAFVLFSADGDFYAKPNAVAAVPAADVTDGSASELNPTLWSLSNVTSIGLIADAARKVTLSFYGN